MISTTINQTTNAEYAKDPWRHDAFTPTAGAMMKGGDMRKARRALRAPIRAVGCLCVIAGTAGAQSGKTAATARGSAHAPNVLTASDARDGWQLLFDGKTLAGWHGLGFRATPPGLWTVEDGAIKHVEHGKGPVQADGQPLTGMDLISDRSFENFELAWEWKIAEAGNSGVKYNVAEALSTAMDPPHAAKGWEYQLIDDEKAEDTKIPSHRSGALYDMFAPNDKKRVNPAGQWNRSSIIFRGNHGEHWLNGEKVVEFDLGTPPFDSAFAASKYKTYPTWFPIRRKGQIVLQDHGDVVWFRDIRIRELK